MKDRRLPALVLALLLALPGCAAGGVEDGPPSAVPPQTVPPQEGSATQAAAPALGAYLARADAYEGMNDPAFWAALCPDPDAVRMTAEEIAAFNASVVADPETLCVDLAAYPASLDRFALEQAIRTYGRWPDAGYYTDAGRISGAQQGEIYDNLALDAVADDNPVRWGFAVRSCALRTWPSPLALYDSEGDIEFDKARESTLRLWEPLAVLHTSADGQWLLVQAYNYLGWLAAEDAALCSREQWLALQARPFVTVRAARVALGDSAHDPSLNGVVLSAGTRLPHSDRSSIDNAETVSAYGVLLPVRREDGTLATRDARIPYSEDVCDGVPVLTDRALLEQAFRLLGQRYGWGGMFGGWDCSSICADTYAVFGVMLPRNSSRQIRVGAADAVSLLTDEEKLAHLASLQTGALVELRGHMMFWLGMYDGRGYVLHATYGFQPEGLSFTVTNSVVVSSVDVLRSGGGSILYNIRATADIKNP